MRRRAAVAGLVAVAVAMALLVGLHVHAVTQWDARAEGDVHRFVLAHHGVRATARVLTHLGDPLVVTLLAVVGALLHYAGGRRWAAAYLLVVRAVAIVVGWVAKETVRRGRPVLAHPVAHAAGFSFPSGHALGSAALYASLAVAGGRWLPRPAAVAVAVVVPVLVATTRVVLGVHYPTDVIAGLALGWAVALAAAFVGWTRGVHREFTTAP